MSYLTIFFSFFFSMISIHYTLRFFCSSQSSSKRFVLALNCFASFIGRFSIIRYWSISNPLVLRVAASHFVLLWEPKVPLTVGSSVTTATSPHHRFLPRCFSLYRHWRLATSKVPNSYRFELVAWLSRPMWCFVLIYIICMSCFDLICIILL